MTKILLAEIQDGVVRGQFQQDQQGAAHLEDSHQPVQQAAAMWVSTQAYLYKPSFGLQMRSLPKSASDRCICIFRSILP